MGTLFALSALLMIKWYGPVIVGHVQNAGNDATDSSDGSIQIVPRHLEGEGEGDDDKKEDDKKEEKKEEEKKDDKKEDETTTTMVAEEVVEDGTTTAAPAAGTAANGAT